MIRQSRNKIMLVFKIMFSLLKCYDNKQKFLIMRLVSDFSKNHFFWIKDDRISLCLFYVNHERYKLKQNCCNDKFWCIDFYSDKIFEIKRNQHKRFYKCFNESSKRLLRGLFKNEWSTLFLLFTHFKQFRQSMNDFNIKSYKTFIKIRKFLKYLQLA